MKIDELERELTRLRPPAVPPEWRDEILATFPVVWNGGGSAVRAGLSDWGRIGWTAVAAGWFAIVGLRVTTPELDEGGPGEAVAWRPCLEERRSLLERLTNNRELVGKEDGTGVSRNPGDLSRALAPWSVGRTRLGAGMVRVG